MVAPRRKQDPDRPDNLYFTRRQDGRIYYYYRHPETQETTGFGYDRAEAFAAARQLNQILGRGRDLVAKVQRGKSPTLGEYLLHYRTQILPARRIKGEPLSPHYVAETTRILARIEDGLGSHRPLDTLTQRDLADYLNALPSAEAYNQHRTRLVQVWTWAVSDGHVPENLPAKIIKRDKTRRRRQRLTLEAYDTIYAAARPAIRNAMELSLNALQRRADIQKWRHDDQRDGYAWVIQQKTRKHGKSAYLRIPLTLPVAHSAAGAATLGELIGACRDDILCPFLVHERPQRVRKSTEKRHPFQLTRKAISDGFAEARDAAGLYTDLAAEEKPSFHELLGLGEWLREQQGWTLKQIQALRGHTSERMTSVYLEGHAYTTIEVPETTKTAR